MNQPAKQDLELSKDLAQPTDQIPATLVTPMQMLQTAVENNQDLDRIEKLMELEKRWKADQAREAFYAALAAFKKVETKVTKDKTNSQYGSRYTSIGNFVNTVNEAMARFGLNARWEIDQTEQIKVTCILSHTLGHNESVSMSGPPDSSGSKNPLQQIKSTITYLEISTYQAVTGVVAQDANIDDDGNAAVATISKEQLADLEALIDEVGADRAKFLTYLKLDSLESMRAKSYATAVKSLEAKRGK